MTGYSDEELASKFEFIASVIEGYLSDVRSEVACGSEGPKVELEVNYRLLKVVVDSTYQDIARHKAYHQADRPGSYLDAVKRVSFLTYWLSRFAPIVVRTGGEGTDEGTLDRLQIVNQIVAVMLAEAFIGHDCESEFVFSNVKRSELIYCLLYRKLDPDGWMVFFNSVKEIVSARSAVSFIEYI